MARPESVVRPQDLGTGRLFETVRDAVIVAGVCDDGRGFDAGASRAGVGLRSMTERAAALGGKLETESGPGEGTKVNFRVPLRKVGGGVTRVMLVEDHAPFRQAIAHVLEREPDLELAAQAGTLGEARLLGEQ